MNLFEERLLDNEGFLFGGGEVTGSDYDGKVGNLTDMDDRSAKRLGYADRDGYWTDRGYHRATSEDYDRLRRDRD